MAVNIQYPQADVFFFNNKQKTITIIIYRTILAVDTLYLPHIDSVTVSAIYLPISFLSLHILTLINSYIYLPKN